MDNNLRGNNLNTEQEKDIEAQVQQVKDGLQQENDEIQEQENTSMQEEEVKNGSAVAQSNRGNANQSETEKLKEELEIVKKQNEDHLNGWRRAKADYLNLKKEIEKKSIELIQFANAGLILQILPIYENFKTALEHITEDDQKKDWVIGVGHIKKQFEDFLKNLGLEPIKTVGEKFDPNLHEAVSSEKLEGKEDDIIIKEVSGGFKLYDKVLEPAKVVVVKN